MTSMNSAMPTVQFGRAINKECERGLRLIRAGHDGAAVNETVTVTGAAEENGTGATKSEYALEHAQHMTVH